MNHVGTRLPAFIWVRPGQNKKIALERVNQEFIKEANRRRKSPRVHDQRTVHAESDTKIQPPGSSGAY